MARRTKMQILLNAVDRANCDREADYKLYENCLINLGKEVYKKSLQSENVEIKLHNPRKDRIR